MIEKIVRKFVKSNDENMIRYGQAMVTSTIGAIANIGLFLLKVIAGTIMHSISIVSDGMNNLSDAFSCLITVFGYKLSSKPADKEHPFGHGRLEYIISFISVVLIYIVTFELFTNSIDRVLHPTDVIFHLPLFIMLVASIFVKLFMAMLYQKVGKQIDSLVLITASQDSQNDVFVTIVSLIAMGLSLLGTSFPFDGIVGVILSIYLCISAFQLTKEIINELLGTPIDAKLMKQLRETILENPEIRGIHDLIVHEYGPGIQYGSAHVEMRSDLTLVEAHDIVDYAEWQIKKRYQINMVLHVDPIALENSDTKLYQDQIQSVLQTIDAKLSIHDLVLVPGKKHINLIFDILIPFSCEVKSDFIQSQLEQYFKENHKNVHLHITFDHEYVDEKGK